ncbi:hypothetical protein KOR42_21720 [Thalassoglobus neptunius]|uniref:Uncharacterized protein n=1 Tax=Thalassoglobus neptunius TaxID=1938619 RepID=A0A5C5X6W8_9PLAN|nr:hypothetical protein [Thalassoglobus neptunius]TWT58786.1 hypothetical protein KOR42_21720 [Thalassoglobus neptunius]
MESLGNGLQLPSGLTSSQFSANHRFNAARIASLAVDLKFSTYFPESYTEGYAYPLIAYVHDHHRSEADLEKWFPAISDQNFLAMGVRAPFPHQLGFPGEFQWKLHRPDASLATVRDCVRAGQSDFNIHSDRVHILGEGEGAIVGLQQLILQNSGEYDLARVRGVICSRLPKRWTEFLPPLRSSHGGRLLILDEVNDAEGQAALDALGHAGVEITVYSPESKFSPVEMVNHWVMAGISTVVF